MKKRTLISVICPVYNEEESIPVFYSRLMAAVKKLRGEHDFELIFINDRSVDGSIDAIQKLRRRDPSVQVLTLSRNFGYQAAVLAGMTYARGDAIATIDVDCEDPPELLPQFIAKWKEGYEVVYGLREGRPEARLLTKIRKLFYRSLKAVADSDIVLDMAEFALISAHIRDIIVNNRNTFPFLRAEIGYAGFSRTGIQYDRQPRVRGKSHYNIWKMAVFASGGILTSSTFPMRFAFYLVPFFILFNVLGILFDLVFGSPALFKVLAVGDLTYGITLLTVYGLYIARIYKNSIARPVFVIDWAKSQHNFSRQELDESNAVRGR